MLALTGMDSSTTPCVEMRYPERNVPRPVLPLDTLASGYDEVFVDSGKIVARAEKASDSSGFLGDLAIVKGVQEPASA